MLTVAAASTIPDTQTQTKGPKGCKKKEKEKKVSYIIKAIGKKNTLYWRSTIPDALQVKRFIFYHV